MKLWEPALQRVDCLIATTSRFRNKNIKTY